jgi:hypothetical protein
MIATQDHHPKIGSDWYHDQWPEPDFHPRYTDSIQRIGEFPNLCGLTVHFDRHGAGDNDDVFQILYFQQEKLEEIMRAAQENIRHLAVRHYPNPQDAIESGYGVFNEKLYLSRFLRKVAAASSLRLSVTHAEMHPDAGVTYRVSYRILQHLVNILCALLYPKKAMQYSGYHADLFRMAT